MVVWRAIRNKREPILTIEESGLGIQAKSA